VKEMLNGRSSYIVCTMTPSTNQPKMAPARKTASAERAWKRATIARNRYAAIE
jgi:hypothetical protein